MIDDGRSNAGVGSEGVFVMGHTSNKWRSVSHVREMRCIG